MILSVIIPCYNCAPVIKRCLDSIDYPDAESIVVDDGSSDDSAKVVGDYAKNHTGVRLLQKANGGVSSARNMGIDAATGKYVMFVDADDFVLPHSIEKAVGMIEQSGADVLKYSYHTVAEGRTQYFGEEDARPVSTEIIKGRYEALKRNDVPDYLVWDGIYRRDLITDNHIRFHTDLHLHEDDVFMGELYCHVDAVAITNLRVYCYVESSSQSSTHNQNRDRQRQLIESGYLAIEHRGGYVEQHCPEAMPLERLKYMRWVCQPKTAIAAGYSLQEYKTVLSRFKALGCWPMDYNWMHAARMDWSWKIRMKNRTKTFLCNHPGLAYTFFNLRNKHK